MSSPCSKWGTQTMQSQEADMTMENSQHSYMIPSSLRRLRPRSMQRQKLGQISRQRKMQRLSQQHLLVAAGDFDLAEVPLVLKAFLQKCPNSTNPVFLTFCLNHPLSGTFSRYLHILAFWQRCFYTKLLMNVRFLENRHFMKLDLTLNLVTYHS